MKTSLIIVLVGISFLSAYGGDLDAPGAKVVTNRSEIYRGDCVTMHFSSVINLTFDKFEEAIERVEYENVQQNTDSPGFLLGLHLHAWMHAWIIVSGGYVKGDDLSYAITTANHHHKMFTLQRDILGLKPE